MLSSSFKTLSLLLAAQAAITGAAKTTLKLGIGSEINGGCNNKFMPIQPGEVTLPEELGADNPSLCLMGKGGLVDICTGKEEKKLDLKLYNLKIEIPKNAPPENDVVYAKAGRQNVSGLIKSCGIDINLKKDIIIIVKKKQMPMMTGEGKIIDRLSGDFIMQLEKGKDFEIIKLSDTNSKSKKKSEKTAKNPIKSAPETDISDEEMTNFYADIEPRRYGPRR